MEQNASDIAIVDLSNALKFAGQHLSIEQIAKVIHESLPHDELIAIHGKLAIRIIEN